MKLFHILALSACLFAHSADAAGTTKAQLLLSAESVRPGDTVIAGVELKMAPGWHTYWKNPGESGMATKIQWELPRGISAEPIQWPIPEKLTVSGLTTYVYHDSVLLLIPLHISANASAGTKKLKANVSWLECEDACLPGSAVIETSLNVGSEFRPSRHAELIASWQKQLPSTQHKLTTQAHWDTPTVDDKRPLIIEWEDNERPGLADFYPFGSDDYEVAGTTEVLTKEDGKIRLRKQVTNFGGDWPTKIEGIIVTKPAAPAVPRAYQVTIASKSP